MSPPSQTYSPNGLAIDDNGILYFSSGDLIYKATQAGVVSTFAGSSFGFEDGLGTAARFDGPTHIVIDDNSMLYVADMRNNAIRKITPEGLVTTFAGGTQGFSDGAGIAAQFRFPWGVTVDSSGNLYVADTGNSAIRKITPEGVVTTLAGGTKGFTDGKGTDAKFDVPAGITIDNSGNLFVVDNGGNAFDGGASDNGTIRKITPDGTVSTLAGSKRGFADGTGLAANFDSPNGITTDGNNLFVTDRNNHAIRKVTKTGVTTTLAGGSFNFYGKPTVLELSTIAVDALGNFYVGEYWGGSISKITGTGVITTFADTPNGANDLTFDSSGNLFAVANHAIYKITPAGVMSIFAGGFGFADGTGTAAKFDNPTSITTDASNNLYVADSSNYAIRKITPAGVVTTIAGGAGRGFVDGTGSAAKFAGPSGIVMGAGGNLYVVDTANYVIRKITPSGAVTTFAGSTQGFADGTGTAARFRYLGGITTDSSGNLYVVDDRVIRKITPAGVVTTLVGQTSSYGFVPGNLPGVINSVGDLIVVGNYLYITQPEGIARVTLF